MVACETLNVRATSACALPLASRWSASCRWSGVSAAGRPNFTPLAFARFLPSPVRARRVRPGVFEALEASAARSECCNDVEQVTGGTCQPVQSGDNQHIAALDLVEKLGQLGAVSLGTADLFLEHLGAACGHQLSLLGCEVLAVGADTRIAVSRHFLTLCVLTSCCHYTKHANQ